MDKRTFDIGYTRLETFFGSKENLTRYEVFWERVKTLPEHAWKAAVDQWIDGELRFPTITQIKARVYANLTHEERMGQNSEPPIPESHVELGRKLAPLFGEYLMGRRPLSEWVMQMRYFAKQAGLEHEVESAIREQRLEELIESQRNSLEDGRSRPEVGVCEDHGAGSDRDLTGEGDQTPTGGAEEEEDSVHYYLEEEES